MRLPILALVASCTVGLSAPAYAAPTCHGQEATVVGSPSTGATGTDGDDVIVSGGAGLVEAGAGDDLVCVTGATREVFAGPGADTVDTTAGASSVETDLGIGVDVFLGGPGWDLVDAGGGEDTAESITTGDGNDRVTTGRRGRPMNDMVDLGPGRDVILLRGLPGTGRVAGGRQHDLVVMSDRTGGGWSVDSRAGTISVGGASMPVTDIEAFDLAALRFDTLSFRGGPADEELSLGQGPRAGPGEARVDMGGGDDSLTIDSSLTGPYDGGPGSDTFVLTGYGGRWVAEQRAVIDLRSGLASVGGGAQAELVSFTNAGLDFFDRNLVRGSADPSTIRVRGCHATVYGGGGDDLVVFQASDGCVGPPAQRSIRAYGEGGADELRGSSGDDVLVGGPGADVAKGARGRDRCSAETRTSC